MAGAIASSPGLQQDSQNRFLDLKRDELRYEIVRSVSENAKESEKLPKLEGDSLLDTQEPFVFRLSVFFFLPSFSDPKKVNQQRKSLLCLVE